MIRHLACLLCLLAGAASAAEQLVPWRQQSPVDSTGMRWDINAEGALARGQNRVVNNANTVLIDGSSQQFPSRQLTADGQTQVFVQQIGTLEYTRRVRLDLKAGVARWVEILRNPGAQPQPVSLQLYTQFPYGLGPVTNEAGQILTAGLGAKDTLLVVAPSQQHGRQNQPNLVMGVVSARAKVRPLVTIDPNNQTVMTAYQVMVPAKGVVVIVHALAQRSGVVDAAALKTLTQSWQSAAFLADLPPEIRRAVVNWGLGDGPSGAPRSIPDELIPAAGDPELLTLGPDSRLRGTAEAKQLAVVTPRGRVEVPFTRVAAIGGGGQGRTAVFLRDGQVLAGRVEGSLRFNLVSGLATTISPDRVGWLVRCALDREAPRLLIKTGDGQVLAADPGTRTLLLATCWGRLDLPLAEIRALTALDSGALMVQLSDGSRILGQLSGPLEVATEWFGNLQLAPTEVSAIGRLEKPREASADEPAGTFLRLVGEQILVGELGLEWLRIMTPAGEVPLLPGQIRRLTGRAGEADCTTGVAVELWGDDTLAGLLLQRRIPMQVHGTTLQIPLADLVELSVPTPSVPSETRERIAALIRDLGDPAWERREEASKALGLLGALARPALEAAVATGDPEVRSRAEALIQAIK